MIIQNQSEKGVLIMDVVLAITIITIGVATAVLIIGLVQQTRVRLALYQRAFIHVRQLLSEAKKQNIYTITPQSFIDDSSNPEFKITLQPIFETPYRVRLDAHVSWVNGFSRDFTVSDWLVDLNSTTDYVDCPIFHTLTSVQEVLHSPIGLPAQMTITDAVLLGDYLYVATDSSVVSDPDLYVISVVNPFEPVVINSLHTGPGIARLTQHGQYLYVANTGVYQFQVISIVNPAQPQLLIQMKLPDVVTGSGGGVGESILYANNFVYLGLTKSIGPELHKIDISELAYPLVVSTLETGSGITDIAANNKNIYVTDALENQLLMINPDPYMQIVQEYRFDNWQVQSGQQVFMLGDTIYLGRSSGGFSNLAPELIILSDTATQTIKVSASIDDLAVSDRWIFALTYAANSFYLRIINAIDNMEKHKLPLSGRGVTMQCRDKYLYVVTTDPTSVFNLFINHANE